MCISKLCNNNAVFKKTKNKTKQFWLTVKLTNLWVNCGSAGFCWNQFSDSTSLCGSTEHSSGISAVSKSVSLSLLHESGAWLNVQLLMEWMLSHRGSQEDISQIKLHKHTDDFYALVFFHVAKASHMTTPNVIVMRKYTVP